MMQKLLRVRLFILSLFLVFLQVAAYGQCTINCPEKVTTTATNSQGAVVNYTTPVIPSGCEGDVQTQTQTFNYTGAAQNFTVPAGVTSITIKAWGAQGGGNIYCSSGGGLGGYAQGSIAVNMGEQLFIYVGEQPNIDRIDNPEGLPGGYNGGGTHGSAGGGGGGASDVRREGNSLANRIIVAGGGGGGAYGCGPGDDGNGGGNGGAGGAGGGLEGRYGANSVYSHQGGGGGTQTSGGEPGFRGQAGSLGQGGNVLGSGAYYSGGGGGYYGGGSARFAAAGGGSGYIGGVTNGSMRTGANEGHGRVEITYTQTLTPTLTQTAGKASGSTFPVGVTTNTFELNDGAGNITSCSFTVTVIDVRCGPKNDKVLVCHKDANGKRSALCIDKKDVASHLAHGDYLGECSRTNAASKVASKEIGVEAASSLTIQVLGNPTPDYFTLLSQGDSKATLSIRVMDASGKVIESRENVAVQSAIELGKTYRSGMYLVEVMQGKQRVMLKLVKSPQ